ncbi:disulfide bond formation protein B [Sphingomonas piscis]|uniref:Disulfide bond formation protein B n=1 Tax=Sphingomonas piscis TaxID=2714943 RepID=A0A6G7YT85_9SPHN|nr:disulfide bond formation protein B [Sphingomonas piscis]
MRTGAARLLALLIPGALLAAAFGSEKFGGLFPCEMCWWQRYAHFAALGLAAVAFTASATTGRSRLLTGLAAAAIAVSGAIGVYHTGVELKIFEGLTTCTSTASGATAADLLKSILEAPVVRCDQVQWSFLGISMAGWNAIISLAGAASVAFLLRRERRS